MERILIIRLKAIGDVVLTLPAVYAIRENFPAAKISYLISAENAPLLRGFAEVNEIIALNRAALRSGNPLKVTSEFLGLLWRLRRGEFDLAVDLHGYGETAWLTRITGAPQRWGRVYRAGRGWAYTRQFKPDPALHAAESHLRMMEECGLKMDAVRNEFVLPTVVVNDARAWFAGQGLDVTRPTVYLQPFTSAPDKNWPFDHYLELASYLKARGVQVIIGGGPSDQPSLDRARSLGFTIPTGLPRLTDAGLMQLSTVVVGGDTGFVHLTVALGRRVVMLMKSKGRGTAVPFRHPEWAIAPQAGSPLATVPAATVIAAVGDALAATGPHY